jgi:hypothetical protein
MCKPAKGDPLRLAGADSRLTAPTSRSWKDQDTKAMTLWVPLQSNAISPVSKKASNSCWVTPDKFPSAGKPALQAQIDVAKRSYAKLAVTWADAPVGKRWAVGSVAYAWIEPMLDRDTSG